MKPIDKTIMVLTEKIQNAMVQQGVIGAAIKTIQRETDKYMSAAENAEQKVCPNLNQTFADLMFALDDEIVKLQKELVEQWNVESGRKQNDPADEGIRAAINESQKPKTRRASVYDDVDGDRFVLCNEETEEQVRLGDVIFDDENRECVVEGGIAPQRRFDPGAIKVKIGSRSYNISLEKFSNITWERI